MRSWATNSGWPLTSWRALSVPDSQGAGILSYPRAFDQDCSCVRLERIKNQGCFPFIYVCAHFLHASISNFIKKYALGFRPRYSLV